MSYDPGTTWTAATAAPVQAPVYFLRIDGVTLTDYSTANVLSAARTKLVCANPPEGGGASMNFIDGSYDQSEVSIELLDVGGAITQLVATERPGAVVSTLINRSATIYGGYRHMVEADYPAIYTGRITSLKENDDQTGYVLGISSLLYQLDADIMTSASDATPITVVGNPVNVFWAILTGTFSTTHSDFPLTTYSSSPAPTGLSISAASINTTLLETERDRWYPSDTVEVVFTEPVSAKSHLEREFFRVFQCFPTIGGDGKIGLRFVMPPIPAGSVTTLTERAHVMEFGGWERLYSEHLNKYTYTCETTKGSDTFDATLYDTASSEDTADQAATGETIEFLVKSKWLSTDYDGAGLATVLAARARSVYLKTPAAVDASVNFTRRNVEHGDVVAVTAANLPNLQTGTRGITDKMMLVTSVAPEFDSGRIRLALMDTGFQRYGVIGYTTQTDYSSATSLDKSTFAWISDGTYNTFSDDSPGYGAL